MNTVINEAALLDRIVSIQWTILSTQPNLPESFIERFQNKLEWSTISGCQILSEPFIEKHKDRVDWTKISQKQKLSESFIKKHKHDVNWMYISRCQKLSESFIEKYQNILDWEYIAMYQNLNEQFVRKFIHKINLTCYILNKRPIPSIIYEHRLHFVTTIDIRICKRIIKRYYAQQRAKRLFIKTILPKECVTMVSTYL